MTTQNIAELIAENISIRACIQNAGPRTKAILLACLDINNRKLAIIESANVIHVNFGGRK